MKKTRHRTRKRIRNRLSPDLRETPQKTGRVVIKAKHQTPQGRHRDYYFPYNSPNTQLC